MVQRSHWTTSLANGRDPSPGPPRLENAPSCAILSPGRGLSFRLRRPRSAAEDKLLIVVVLLAIMATLPSGLCAQGIPKFDLTAGPLELAGPASPWRFVNAVGEQSGLWGFENGTLEGWVYPLKIFHDLQLAFELEGDPRIYAGAEIARSVRVRPHAVLIQYSAEQFSVNETLFAPRQRPGFGILLDVQAPANLTVLVRFKPDLNLMWPGGIGGQSYTWDADNKWIKLEEPSGRFSALIGSPLATGGTAVGYHAYLPNEHPDETIELQISPGQAKNSYIPIVVTGGIKGAYDAPATYREILRDLPGLYEQSLHHDVELDAQGTQFQTPDLEVNGALRWSRISLDQLKVCNPYVGCSYVSGYGSSGTGTRPMYCWFFDEPVITSWAYLEYGGAENTKEALRFIQKYQRADGKIPHEISQSAGLINWFKDYPFPYIHPDSALWYLVAMGHFYRFTGDQDFVRQSWPSIRKAYDYCISILDPRDGLPAIPKDEWGSAELATFSKDAAMAGEWIAALRAVRGISDLMREDALKKDCEEREQTAEASLEREFWNPQSNYYDYGLDTASKPVTYLNPAIGYCAWLGSLPEAHARAVLDRLNTAAFLSDWGQRNMSLEDPHYTEGSYHIGSAWPFMTAGPMLAQFRYHNAVQGFSTWRSMICLRGFGARGAMPEVLTGFQLRLLDDAVPHQMFSELTAIPGLVNGILGLGLDVPLRTLALSPHLPPDWPEVTVRQFPFGQEMLGLELGQKSDTLTAALEFTGPQPVKVEFSPALPAGSIVKSVLQDGKPVNFHVENSDSDVHASTVVTVSRKSTLAVRYTPGVAVKVDWQPILEGDSSRNLRVLNTVYRDGQLQMDVEGLPLQPYRVQLFTPWKVSALEGARIVESTSQGTTMELTSPRETVGARDRSGYTRWKVRVQLQK